MKSNIISEIGENYEYVKTIVHNEVELKKLDIIESSSNILGSLILGLALFLFAFLSFCTAMALITILLVKALGSTVIALSVVLMSFIVMGAITYAFRQTIILKPISTMFLKLFNFSS